MVRVERGIAPAGFVELTAGLRAEWDTAFVLDGLSISKFCGTVRHRLRDAAAALALRNHGKCAFCESVPGATASLQIEHYRPKSEFAGVAFEWSNWLPACPLCNTKKSTRFPVCGADPCLVDPASEEPTEFIGFKDDLATGLVQRGEETISLVALNRDQLQAERRAHLEQLKRYTVFLLSDDPTVKDLAREFLIRSAQPSRRYSAMSKQYLRDRLPGLVDVLPQDPFDLDACLEALIEIPGGTLPESQ